MLLWNAQNGWVCPGALDRMMQWAGGRCTVDNRLEQRRCSTCASKNMMLHLVFISFCQSLPWSLNWHDRTTGQNLHLCFISFQICLNCLFPTLWLESSQRGQLSSETKMVHSAWACQRQTLKMGRNQFPKLRSFKLTISVTICLTLSNVYIFIHENYEKGSTITICMVSEVLA